MCKVRILHCVNEASQKILSKDVLGVDWCHTSSAIQILALKMYVWLMLMPSPWLLTVQFLYTERFKCSFRWHKTKRFVVCEKGVWIQIWLSDAFMSEDLKVRSQIIRGNVLHTSSTCWSSHIFKHVTQDAHTATTLTFDQPCICYEITSHRSISWTVWSPFNYLWTEKKGHHTPLWDISGISHL